MVQNLNLGFKTLPGRGVTSVILMEKLGMPVELGLAAVSLTDKTAWPKAMQQEIALLLRS